MIVVAVSEGGLMGYYKTACICLNGHLVAGDSRSEDAAPKCPDCVATTISQCPDCSTDIRGTFDSDFGYYSTPPVKPYCRQCGAPYSWTKSRIDGVMELADAIDELTDNERDRLRDLLSHKIGRAHVYTPVTTAHPVCCSL